MNGVRKTICSVVCIMLVSACGGGGGQGGDGGSDSRDGVRMLHGAIDAAPVDVVSSTRSEAVITQAMFAGGKGYRSLPRGAQSLSVVRAFSPTQAVASFGLTVDAGDRYSVLLYGDNQTFGLRTRLLKDDVPQDFDGALVRLVNGATGASELSISIVASGSLAGSSIVPFGEHSEYLSVPVGDATVRAVRRADGTFATSTAVTLEEGGAYTFLVAGEVGYYTKGVLLRDK